MKEMDTQNLDTQHRREILQKSIDDEKCLKLEEYQKLLDKMKELEKKWNTHFIQCTSDVERDAERLKKNIC